jgi:hypothetical protein
MREVPVVLFGRTISVLQKFWIGCTFASSRLDRRGVRVVTDVGRDAMDAGPHHLTRDAAADGKSVWS